MASTDPSVSRQWRDNLLRKQGYPSQKGIPSVEELLTPLESEFLDWLIDPNRQGNQKQFAEAHGVTPISLSEMKRKEYFQRAWRQRADKLNGGPERIQLVADALFQAAQQDWRAAQAYLAWVEKMSPPRKPEAPSDALRDMSDEDLRAKLTELLKGV